MALRFNPLTGNLDITGSSGDTSNLVPYTGATTDVDLGVNTLFLGAEHNAGYITGINATTANKFGGGLNLVTGDGLGAGSGGALNLYVGYAGDTGPGGSIIFTSGNGGATSGGSGGVGIRCGETVSGNGGSVDISSGYTEGGGVHGTINFTGQVKLIDIESNVTALLDTTSLTTTDKTFTFPDASGTIALTSDITADLPLVGGTMTGAIEASDHGTASIDQVINMCYGTGAPPDASTTTEGSLFITYTP